MLRKISIPVVILALLLLPLTAAAQAGKTPPRLTGVHFDSRPEFAEIRVDGVFVGSAPLGYRLTPGMHKIELSRHGFAPWTRDLLVSEDAPTNVIALLDDDGVKPCSGK